MDELPKIALTIAKEIQDGVPKRGRPPSEGLEAESEQVIPFSYVYRTRNYIEKVVNQINGCYERGWFDACAVMIRRLIETLIIEAFEHHGIDSKIKNPTSGDFYSLDDLIAKTLSEPKWNLGRMTKRVLPDLPSVGNLSAHSRRFTAHRGDIDKDIQNLRTVVQEFIELAELKRK
jgi:hypothetical protein